MSFNPFLIASAVLNCLTAGWYFFNNGPALGCVYLGYSFASVAIIFVKVQ